MVHLKYLSTARFRGPEAAQFLQSQLSADIRALADGDACFACCCTPKGQVISLLLVCRQGDEYLVAGAASLLEQTLTRLKMFVLRTRVEFVVEPDTRVYGRVQADDPRIAGEFEPAGLGLIYQFRTRADAGVASPGQFKAEEIRQGVVWLGTETSEKFIPQMLGFDAIGAVSFSKGCYPGQEIVARARYLGKVKRKPAIVQTAEPCPVKPSERVEMNRSETWVSGVAVDTASTGDGTLLFVVASAEPDAPVAELKVADRLYRCATM